MDTPTFPNLTRFLRRGVFVWLGYLLVLAGLGFAFAREPFFVPWFSLSQSAVALVLLGLTWEPLAARLGRAYLPSVILLMSALPIALNHLVVRLGSGAPFNSAEGTTLRLLPLLVMALVLISWCYSWRHVVLFALGATLWEMVWVVFNSAFPVPPNPNQPRPPLPPQPTVFGLAPQFIPATVASFVQMGVLLVIGSFISRLMLRVREQNAALEQLARTDPLTGLLNRRYFWELAEKEVQRARRHERVLAVALFDLDHFKTINDTYGHLVGDQVIRFFAAEGQKNFRATDLFARYGGEEFVCLLMEASAEDALHKAEAMRQWIQANPVKVEQQKIPVTVSVGVAELSPREAITLGELVNRADFALYKAKAGGRNRVTLFGAP